MLDCVAEIPQEKESRFGAVGSCRITGRIACRLLFSRRRQDQGEHKHGQQHTPREDQELAFCRFEGNRHPSASSCDTASRKSPAEAGW